MYELSGVTKDYPKGRGVVRALRGVDLAVGDGEWLAVQGPTGHGTPTAGSGEVTRTSTPSHARRL
jgi:putative ABC transport system ATP-binding protein